MCYNFSDWFRIYQTWILKASKKIQYFSLFIQDTIFCFKFIIKILQIKIPKKLWKFEYFLLLKQFSWLYFFLTMVDNKPVPFGVWFVNLYTLFLLLTLRLWKWGNIITSFLSRFFNFLLCNFFITLFIFYWCQSFYFSFTLDFLSGFDISFWFYLWFLSTFVCDSFLLLFAIREL